MKQTTLAVPADDPKPSVTWELVYTDSFDRRAPPKVERVGSGLIPGLIELWARFLFESVKGGRSGFSSFQLYLSITRVVYIDGDMTAAQGLKEWVFGDTTSSMRGYLEEANLERLTAIARAHARLLVNDDGSHGAHLGKAFCAPLFAAAARSPGDLFAALANIA